MKCKVWFAVLLMLALSVLVVSAEEIEIYTQETLSQAGEGYFILEGDTFRKLPVNMTDSDYFLTNDTNWYFVDLPDAEMCPVVLNRNTVQLVTTDNPGYRFVECRQIGRCWWTCPMSLSGSYEYAEYFEGMQVEKQFLGYQSDLKDADLWEVEGVEYTSFQDWRMGISKGTGWNVESIAYRGKMVFAAWSPAKITIGGYRGTVYVSETLELHDWLVEVGKNIPCEVIHTKNGYFIIDLSNLEPGMYTINNRVIQLVDE